MIQQIKVDLLLYATLAARVPGISAGKPTTMHVDRETKVGELVESLSIPRDAVHLVFVNGKIATSEQRLHQGDRVALFPPVGGG